MSAKKMICLLLTAVLHFGSFGGATKTEQCFRISAAFRTNNGVYLADGDKYIKIDANFNEIESGKLSLEFGQPAPSLDAALVSLGDQKLYFFQGNHYYTISSNLKTLGPASINADWGVFFEGGLQATGRLGNLTYFFNDDCKFLTTERDAKVEELEVLGLPCDLDAAWNMESKLFLTKGDNYWSLYSNRSLEGPYKLHHLLNLKSAVLCRVNGYVSLARKRAELSYEKKHTCVIIDAVIEWHDKVYIFNNKKYISLNNAGDENGRGLILEWGGLTDDLDAALVYAGNNGTYFFKDDGYYRYVLDLFSQKHVAVGRTLSRDIWGSFFDDGIDAAGTHKDKSYFFKGCQVTIYEGAKPKQTGLFNLTDIGLPCHVDAVFSRSDNFYVVKRNQVWSKHANNTFSGPTPLSSVVRITSWKICDP